ncbi:tRNA adenosine(34) deaminase TadA [Thiohalobacter thiocyanaticus]|uniref:tRNA-specific adenosine deaminase n=1 Tax=Thiohalobacter thiocyanaticus TaxID=585455 RepID=A0A426QH28_9GAMM|nr:tRNA adenosine(34) deaminase TadA [Thiohalobacter thiocyanaticus]RRQ21059.1 tRNA adenosine(34) deaminase TadA [Thiohalobacter thiocyanaticus]
MDTALDSPEDRDEYWMRQALAQAELAAAAGEVPIGAVLVKEGELIASGWNQPIASYDPSAHAEIQTLRAAGAALQNYRLPDTTLYVTLEPCLMCTGAMIHARISRLVFGAHDSKRGVVDSRWEVFDAPWLNHRVEVTGGVLESECAELLKDFFRDRRE